MSKVYEIVTERILALLERGTVPWHRPWAGGGLPMNYRGTEYRGVNPFILAAQGYASPYWLTYKQSKSAGGHVRKGEKSTPVIFWKWLEKKDAETGEEKR